MFKPIPDMTYTLKLYWYKENLFQTYTRYVLYFKAILENFVSNWHLIWHVLQSYTGYFFNTKKILFQAYTRYYLYLK